MRKEKRGGRGAIYGRTEEEWQQLEDAGWEFLKEKAAERPGDAADPTVSYSDANDELAARTGQPRFDFGQRAGRATMGYLLGRISRSRSWPTSRLLISALVRCFQPEPPPPLVTEHIEFSGRSVWRDESIITQPFHEGRQVVTRIRRGRLIATVTAGRVTITRVAGGAEIPFSAAVALQRPVVRKLLAAGTRNRCAPAASLLRNGPLIDGRPTAVLSIGPSPCPRPDVPQANGPATYWLDEQTFLVLRAVLHSQGNRVAETVRVTSLRYHPRFPAGTFRLPRPGPRPTACPPVTSLPDLTALRRALAYQPVIPSSLPRGMRIGRISSSGATRPHCKITTFTITYLGSDGHPAIQFYEAPQTSPSVRFPGSPVTVHPGLTGTLNRGHGTAILWWLQDGRYIALQSGGLTAGVRLTGIPTAALLRVAASVGR